MKFDSSISQARMPSPLGTIAIAATAQGLAGLWFTEGQRYLPPELLTTPSASPVAARPAGEAEEIEEVAQAAPSRCPAFWPSAPDHPVLEKTRQQLAAYFAGERRDFELPLDLCSGTAFQQTVWQALLQIAPGETVSYGQISRRLGKPGAVRAVGAAIARNPISIIVPCHRVMGVSGALTGYAGGLERKTALLRLEGALEEALL